MNSLHSPSRFTRSLLQLPFTLIFLVAILFTGCDSGTVLDSKTADGPLQPENSVSGTSAAVFGPGLEQSLDLLDVNETLTVIVSFDKEGPLSPSQINAVEALGITRGLTFETLPMIGIAATAGQVYQLAEMNGVQSIWPNLELEYHNDWATELTGVDRVRNDPALYNGQGEPLTGSGVSVLVNDSGIDATHGDLLFGTHVVQNVQAVTNLNALSDLLPVTYQEDQQNSDLGSGHGTHVAGTVGGTGAQSGGLYEGVAPGADLVGYGSGGGILILDALGGFDYALSNQHAFEEPIRIITNSWGTSGAFDPNDPINLASYQAYKSGMSVVFSAGNSGPDANTLNPYSVAPWTISVAAGDVNSELAGFSSRGMADDETTFTMADGQTWTAVNEPTITGPGVDIISARATTNVAANGLTNDVGNISLAHLPYYTMISGTSMSAPHVAGVAALMLEADPSLTPDQVKQILIDSASDMPGYSAWEAGAGYVNAYGAVNRIFETAAATQ